jgi:hypothetical protein
MSDHDRDLHSWANAQQDDWLGQDIADRRQRVADAFREENGYAPSDAELNEMIADLESRQLP